MNVLKRIKAVSLLTALIIISSCNNEEHINFSEDQLLLGELNPELVNLVDFDTKGTYSSENGNIVYYKIKDKNNSFLFKDYSGDFSIVDILENEKFIYTGISKDINLNFEMTYNKEYDTKIVNLKSTLNNQISKQLLRKGSTSCSTGYAVDLGLCLIGAAGIAASDGPLPFADALAVTFGVACGVRAADTLGACLNNQ